MQDKKWVAGWGAATTTVGQCHADYFKDQTFRDVFFPTMNASAVRLHFSNRFGTENCVLTKANIAISTGGSSIDTETIVPITFGGADSLTMWPGGEYVSDEIPFRITAGISYVVNMYFADFTQLQTGHSNNGYYIKKYYSKGDLTESADIPLETLGTDGPYVFLNTIDFLTDDDCSAIIAFGDSITAQPWPDCFAHRIYDLGIRNRSVIRRGIGGGRVLREYRWRCKKHFGVAGVKRFEQDVSSVVGAEAVIVLHGINDLLHPMPDNVICPMSELPTAEELIDGYKKYIEIAHKHGLKVYLCTVLPCTKLMGIADKNETRLRANEWIRSQTESDGIIDFEAAVWNPDDHDNMLPEFDSGDHLHPSFNGAKRLADSIPESIFRIV